MHQSVQAGFACGVMRSDDAAVQPRDRRDEQHAAEAPFDHARQYLLGKQKRRGQVDRQRDVPQLQIDVLPTSYGGGAGVGDQDVDAAQLAVGLPDEARGSGGIGQIGGRDHGAPAQSAGVFADLFSIVSVPRVRQEQVDTGFGKSARDSRRFRPMHR